MIFSHSLADVMEGMPASVVQSKLALWTHEELAEYDAKREKTGYHVLAGLTSVKVPGSRWNMEAFQLKNDCGSTPLHVLAARGKAGSLQAKFLTRENLFAENDDGFTPYHWMVKAGQFDKIPREFRTLQNLLNPAKNGVTPLHLAARFSYLYTIPEELGFKKQSVLETPTEDGLTVFHYIAMGGDWSKLPGDVRTLSNCMLVDSEGLNCLHHAAHHNNLRSMPAEFITQSTITWSHSASRRTVLHNAAISGSLNDVPPALLTPRNLLLEDSNGATPLSLAIAQGNLEQIPVFGKEYFAPLPPQERDAWEAVCKRFSLPLPEVLTKKWEHVQSDGGWQHL